MRLILFVFLCFSGAIQASICQQPSNECVELRKWNGGVALGGGVITNPLNGGDNIPLILLPYFNYYDERFFIDNLTLGYTLSEHAQFDVSIVSELNTEQAFFETFHASNLVLPDSSFGLSLDEGGPLVEDHDRTIEIDEIAKRKWAVDIGVLSHWYPSENIKATFSLLHDVSGHYRGHHAMVSLSHQQQLALYLPNQFIVTAGVNYKSANLTDYYYGIDEKDKVDARFFYNAAHSVNSFISMTLKIKINDAWQLRLNTKYQHLGSGMRNSPLVEEDHSISFFVGGVYAF